LSSADKVEVYWRISEYEVVDDNEASHVDKPGGAKAITVYDAVFSCLTSAYKQKHHHHHHHHHHHDHHNHFIYPLNSMTKSKLQQIRQ